MVTNIVSLIVYNKLVDMVTNIVSLTVYNKLVDNVTNIVSCHIVLSTGGHGNLYCISDCV